ncbi:type II toxin-antitoxin system VapC family toxin [Haloferula sargassicola]|uniref:Ribonuclease VapC n=1 Tax=Haloferula sargassicola TaxID=490096 RepID=A0ABP9UK51_9BACT
MIILDTNVVSELMKAAPDERVAAWLQRQQTLHLAITTVTVGEIQYGIRLLSRGKRRDGLEKDFAAFVARGFEGRLLTYDEPAAVAYGEIAAQRKRKGYEIDAVDLMIAAMAKIANASVATRNTKDFVGCGVKLIDPWQSNS